MTREEAIKLIDDRMCFGRGKWSKHHMPERDAYWEAGEMAIEALEQPERKKGKWISLDDLRGKYNTCGYKCSECGEYSEYEENYCPSCGADMRGEQE